MPKTLYPTDLPAALAVLDGIPKRFFVRYYREHGRSMPWRQEKPSPWGFLVLEMMLRQTLASMVRELWPQFVARYPTPAACIEEDRSRLVEFLKPLGLSTQRAFALQSAAQSVVDHHGGQVPRQIGDLMKLPHVGPYAAHAVACFCFGQRVPIVDVNVLRLFVRLTGQKLSEDARRAKAAWEMARHILPPRDPREHNWGVLDFCAQVCQPLRPCCEICPLAPGCHTGRAKLQASHQQ